MSITANADCVEPFNAIIIGSIGAIFYSLACKFMNHLQVDDAIEATQVHGVCGLWGCIATALFSRDQGLFYLKENSVKFLGV